MRFLFLLFGLVLVLAGCGREWLNKQHEQYLSSNGWDIKKKLEVKTYILDIPDVILANYQASGITFLEHYLGEEVTETTYMLKEKDADGVRLTAVIFETKEGIIGGIGVLPNWTPGTFNLEDKKRLIDEKLIKQ